MDENTTLTERVQGLEENAQDLREALGKRQEQVKRYRETLKGVLKILDSENWSKYDSSALQDNLHDYITLENGELLEGEE